MIQVQGSIISFIILLTCLQIASSYYAAPTGIPFNSTFKARSIAMSTDGQFMFIKNNECGINEDSAIYTRLHTGSVIRKGSTTNANSSLGCQVLYSTNAYFTEDNSRLIVFSLKSTLYYSYVLNPLVGTDPLNNAIQQIPQSSNGVISYDGRIMVFCSISNDNCKLYNWNAATSKYQLRNANPFTFADGTNNDVTRMKMSPDGNLICIARDTPLVDVIILKLSPSGFSYQDLLIETSSNQHGDYIECDISNSMAVFGSGNAALPVKIFKKTNVGGIINFTLLQSISYTRNCTIIKISYFNNYIALALNNNVLNMLELNPTTGLYAKIASQQFSFTTAIVNFEMTMDSSILTIAVLNGGYYVKLEAYCRLVYHGIMCAAGDFLDECSTDYSWSITAGVGCVYCHRALLCARCDIANQCKICAAGYSLNDAKKCIFCQTTLYCLKCNTYNQCVTCKDNYFLNPAVTPGKGCCLVSNSFSSTLNACVTCNVTLNCNRCNVAGQCADCKDTYSLNPTGQTGKGCCLVNFTWSSTTEACVSCDSTLNCNKCNTAGQCTNCKDTYSLNPTGQNGKGCCLVDFSWSSNTEACVSCDSTLNCKQCNVAGQCLSCKDTYSLNPTGISGKGCCLATFTWSSTTEACVACGSTLNCNRCNVAGQCAECKSTYNLNHASQPGNGCCLANYVWNNTLNQCIQCQKTILNCEHCPIINQCSICKTGFSLNANSIQGTGCCQSQYTWSIVSGSNCVSCKTSLLNCNRCDIADQCKICKSGFYLNDDSFGGKGCCAVQNSWSLTLSVCVSCLTSLNCKYCEQAGRCNQCKSGFNYSPSDSSGCCLTGEIWSEISSICIACPSTLNCARCEIVNQCEQCASGFSLYPDSAVGCCQTAKTWSNTQQTCIICPETLKCSRCDDDYNCALCKQGFQPQFQSSTPGIATISSPRGCIVNQSYVNHLNSTSQTISTKVVIGIVICGTAGTILVTMAVVWVVSKFTASKSIAKIGNNTKQMVQVQYINQDSLDSSAVHASQNFFKRIKRFQKPSY